MTDETTITTKESVQTTSETVGKPRPTESHFFRVSLRGLITLSVVWTAAYCQVVSIEIKEPFYTMLSMIVAYYFGQNSKTNPQK